MQISKHSCTLHGPISTTLLFAGFSLPSPWDALVTAKAKAAIPLPTIGTRYKRYGTVFRAYLFGYEFIIIGDPSLLKGSLSNEEDVGFTLPVATANEIIDPYNMSDAHRHPCFRKHMAQAFGPIHVKARLPLVQAILAQYSSSWFQQGTVKVERLVRVGGEGNILTFASTLTCPAFACLPPQLRSMVIKVAFSVAAGFELEPETLDTLAELALTTQTGIFSVPLDLPGTAWHTARRTKSAYVQLLASIIKARFGVDPETGGVQIPPQLVASDAAPHPGSLDGMLALMKEFIEMGVG